MRKRMGMVGFAVAVGAITGVSGGVLPSGQPAAAAAGCTGGTSTDFNGDGVTDTLVADPGATVGGAARAGLVRVVLGGGKGVFEISQATSGMNATPERGDQFGYARAAYDADGDGCTDLVVGAPYEDVPQDGKNLIDAGGIWVIHGTPTGIGAGSPMESYTQHQFDTSTTTEEYDRFGFAFHAGTTSASAPYLVIGAPGENVSSGGTDYADAGCIHYMQGTTKYTVNEDDPGVPGVVEAHDRFGYSLTGTNRYFAVGAPGETIGDDAVFAGAVAVFSHTLTAGVPTGLAGIDQGASGEGLTGVAEANDQFGTSIDMTNYRPSDQTYNSDALLAIGVPGEAIGATPAAGSVALVRVQPSGTVTEITSVDAGTTDVEGDPTAGDSMGQRVALANTDTTVVSGDATIRLVVGIPGRDVGTAKDAGVLQSFRPLGPAIGTGDKVINRAADGSVLPGTATARDYTGISLTSGSVNLYVGVPYSKESATAKGVLYVVPWTDIDGTTSTGTTTFQPGAGGIPDVGTSFGVVG
ncbi:FG-GAP and VCBS repeat-containing protein [Streptomyces luteolus]|uniref:VCBS repeat-containing protein n=1 Tax=Streptomyces luteolus TaxID=3043615 RepID=A0ABT6T756_9ACTN|nr:VCBS repeat-containing protein [Streptomyces sp. B-S-A12]MDI3422697.1 VCBS repeat-containing protein [Streptomyces sp. B-S-A12]